MYNHVSQVVYFHDSQYSRTARHPLEDIENAPAGHVLPAIQQLFPSIPVRFEEDRFDPTKGEGWYWLILAGRVYLVSPEPAVLHAENVLYLLHYYEQRQAKPPKTGSPQ